MDAPGNCLWCQSRRGLGSLEGASGDLTSYCRLRAALAQTCLASDGPAPHLDVRALRAARSLYSTALSLVAPLGPRDAWCYGGAGWGVRFHPTIRTTPRSPAFGWPDLAPIPCLCVSHSPALSLQPCKGSWQTQAPHTIQD